VILPAVTKNPDIEIPNVSKLTVIDAERQLKDAGFEVALETMKEESDTIEKGLVTRTSPGAGRTVKKGTIITIYESTGQQTYEVEDFTGKNYIEVQTELEKLYGLKVEVVEREIDDSDQYTSQQIVGQSVDPGTTLKKGDSITLYIPEADDGYPDMVADGWTLDDVRAFCDKYGITLTIEYFPTTDSPEGTLISQSRSPKTPIVKGSVFKITVAQEPVATPTPTPTKSPDLGIFPTPTPTSSPSANPVE